MPLLLHLFHCNSLSSLETWPNLCLQFNLMAENLLIGDPPIIFNWRGSGSEILLESVRVRSSRSRSLPLAFALFVPLIYSYLSPLSIVDMECVVQGIIETQHVEALEILLQGLCGVQRERLRIHEICLKSGPHLGTVASEVRLLCDLEQAEPSWTVKHVGGAMRGAGAEQISVLVRSMVESKTSKNALRMFYTLGYKLDHELLRVGFSFNFHRGAQITVTVSSINKMLKLHATDEAVPVTPGIQMVEVTAPATAETYAEVASAVSSFCEYLAPLLHLSKPGISTGVVPTAAAAAASLMSDGGGTNL
ncbi:Mediator of RNA polymerase II transcription subunit 18 isoform A [Glycine soja]|nr:Mediator of RNA polymerase II transcription subunit 18 isoform A [Glycine soja]